MTWKIPNGKLSTRRKTIEEKLRSGLTIIISANSLSLSPSIQLSTRMLEKRKSQFSTEHREEKTEWLFFKCFKSSNTPLCVNCWASGSRYYTLLCSCTLYVPTEMFTYFVPFRFSIVRPVHVPKPNAKLIEISMIS